MQQFDIAIVGGGLVGASFARAVANTGLSIVIIDRAPATALYQAAMDNRGLAISYTTKKILTELNLWHDLRSKVYPIQAVHVSEQGSFGFTKLAAEKHNLSALGYVVSAANLSAALMQGLELLPNVTVLRPETITNLDFDHNAQTWQIDLSKQTIRAKLFIAADGTNSILHKSQALTVHTKDYAQTALVTNVKVKQKIYATAYERFTARGVLALLPFGAQLKCVWTAPNSELQNIMHSTDQQFCNMLQQAMGFRLGEFVAVDERKTFPIVHTYTEQLYGTACVLLGNAANTLHPVAAQGFNLGIRDAMALTSVLRDALKLGAPINSASILKNYAAMRSSDHQRTRDFSNSLVEVFANDLPLVKFSRRIGLVAAQLIPTLKRKILNKGLGIWM